MGITLRLHQWTYDGGQSFPKIIVYVSNNNDFEYAFPFVDEYYYYIISKDKSNAWLKNNLDEHMTFGQNINYLVWSLGFNKKSNSKKLTHFMTLLLDSLLQMHEITANNITALKSHYEDPKIYWHGTFRDSTLACLSRIEKNLINHPLRYRYFNCHEGFDGFWQFDIENSKSQFLLSIEFLNKERYSSLYW